MLTASIVIDLSRPPTDPFDVFDDRDRRSVYQAGLDAVPIGTRVIVLVGARHCTVDPSAVRLLHEHVDRLNLDVRGVDGDTVAAWHSAILAGDLGMVA